MNTPPKTQSRLGVIVMVVGFLTWMFSQMHGCKLKSLWIELPMLLSFLILVPAWVSCAIGIRRVILRSLGAVIIVIGVQSGYLAWLHSERFPQWLLFPKSGIHKKVETKEQTAKWTFI